MNCLLDVPPCLLACKKYFGSVYFIHYVDYVDISLAIFPIHSDIQDEAK